MKKVMVIFSFLISLLLLVYTPFNINANDFPGEAPPIDAILEDAHKGILRNDGTIKTTVQTQLINEEFYVETVEVVQRQPNTFSAGIGVENYISTRSTIIYSDLNNNKTDGSITIRLYTTVSYATLTFAVTGIRINSVSAYWERLDSNFRVTSVYAFVGQTGAGFDPSGNLKTNIDEMDSTTWTSPAANSRKTLTTNNFYYITKAASGNSGGNFTAYFQRNTGGTINSLYLPTTLI